MEKGNIQINQNNDLQLTSNGKVKISVSAADRPLRVVIHNDNVCCLNQFDSFGTAANVGYHGGSAYRDNSGSLNDAGSQWQLFEVTYGPVTQMTTSGLPVAELKDDEEHLIVSADKLYNNQEHHTLTSTQQGAHLKVATDMTTSQFGEEAVWTFEYDSTDENGNLLGWLKSKNGYLVIAGGGSDGTTKCVANKESATKLTFQNGSNSGLQMDAWRIHSGTTHLNRRDNWDGTYNHNGDNGNHWYFYEVIKPTTSITFTAKAVGTTTITIGGTTYTINVACPGHEYDDDCTDVICNICGEKTREGAEHQYENKCTDTKCINCEATRVAPGHDYGELVPAQDEVHKKDELKAGVAAHYQCSVCEKYFTENKDETTLEALTGKIPEHNYGEATCTAPATCSCGATTGSPMNHAWGEWTEVTPATCIAYATYQRVCKNDATHVDTMEGTEFADHAWETVGEYTAPTFEANGFTTFECTVEGCDETKVVYDDPATTKTAVAQVGEAKFESLAEAVAAAEAGDTVTLLADTNGNGIIIDKDVTIDLAGFTYTIDGVLVGSTGTKSCGFQILSGNTVTIKNGSIVMGEGAVRGHDSKVGNNFVIQNYANMTLENVAVTGNSYTSYVVSNNSGNVVMTNTTITAVKEGAVAFDVCKYASYAEPTVTVDGCVINGKIEAAANIGNTYYATLQNAFNAVEDGETITLMADVKLNTYLNVTAAGEIILNLAGYSITRDEGTGIYVDNAETVLNIVGEGSVEATQAVWANAGTVVIHEGEFFGTGDAIYTTGNGHIEIHGGTFSAAETDHTANTYAVLNQKDNARDTSSITVYGGTFVGFNPANNYSEGAGTNFVAKGYCSRETEGVWTVYAEHAYEIVDGKLVCACGEIDTGYTGIYGDYYFDNGEMQKAYKLVKYDGDYYFINDYNKIAKSVTLYLQEKWVAEYGLGEGRYEFDAEGKMMRNGTETGIVGDYYYIDGVQQKAYQLVQIGDDFYFINDGNKIAKNVPLYLQAKWVEEYGLKEGLYEFGANGKLVRNGKVTGVADDYLYIDGILQRKYQMVKIGDDFYFINDYDKVAKDTVLYLQDKWTGKYNLSAGLYWFNEYGIMTDRAGNPISN